MPWYGDKFIPSQYGLMHTLVDGGAESILGSDWVDEILAILDVTGGDGVTLLFAPNFVTLEAEGYTAPTTIRSSSAWVHDYLGVYHEAIDNKHRWVGGRVTGSGASLAYSTDDGSSNPLHPSTTYKGETFWSHYPAYADATSYTAGDRVNGEDGYYYSRDSNGTSSGTRIADDTGQWSQLGRYQSEFGLLVEFAATNYAPYSDLSSPAHNLGMTSSTDVGNGMYSMLCDGSDGLHRYGDQLITTPFGSTSVVTISWVVDSDSTAAFGICLVNSPSTGGSGQLGVEVDFSDMTVIGTGQGGQTVIDTGIIHLGGTKWRAWVTGTTGQTWDVGTPARLYYIANDQTTSGDMSQVGIISWDSDGTETLICGWPQIEAGYVPTSPIVTAGGAVTRATEENKYKWGGYSSPTDNVLYYMDVYVSKNITNGAGQVALFGGFGSVSSIAIDNSNDLDAIELVSSTTNVEIARQYNTDVDDIGAQVRILIAHAADGGGALRHYVDGTLSGGTTNDDITQDELSGSASILVSNVNTGYLIMRNLFVFERGTVTTSDGITWLTDNFAPQNFKDRIMADVILVVPEAEDFDALPTNERTALTAKEMELPHPINPMPGTQAAAGLKAVQLRIDGTMAELVSFIATYSKSWVILSFQDQHETRGTRNAEKALDPADLLPYLEGIVTASDIRSRNFVLHRYAGRPNWAFTAL